MEISQDEYEELCEQTDDVVDESMNNFTTYVWLADFHAPYHDKKTLESVLKYVENEKPENIVLGGDVMDFYSVSNFDKDPNRASNMQYEIDTTIDILNQIDDASPESTITYLKGNHEERMNSYLESHPELHGLRALDLENLLKLDDMDIEYKDSFINKGFLFKHGDYSYKYSAAKELREEIMSGMSGHVHKNQMHSKSGRNKTIEWYTVGHLSDEEQADYLSENNNWQQGIGVVRFRNNSGRYHAEILPIKKHRIVDAKGETDYK